jgi:hypothetical protein
VVVKVADRSVATAEGNALATAYLTCHWHRIGGTKRPTAGIKLLNIVSGAAPSLAGAGAGQQPSLLQNLERLPPPA